MPSEPPNPGFTEHPDLPSVPPTVMAPPTFQGQIPIPERQPRWPTVLGIIAVIFGAGGILIYSWGVVSSLIPADGVAAVKRFVVDRVMQAGGKVCPPTIVGVGVGGTSDLCMHLAKVAATRPLGTRCADAEGAKLEAELSEAVNSLGIGPQGLGGDSTAFAVHVETAATHITMNPVAVNIQCHSARRASATFTPDGIAIGF